jgi:hypothetical protein
VLFTGQVEIFLQRKELSETFVNHAMFNIWLEILQGNQRLYDAIKNSSSSSSPHLSLLSLLMSRIIKVWMKYSLDGQFDGKVFAILLGKAFSIKSFRICVFVSPPSPDSTLNTESAVQELVETSSSRCLEFSQNNNVIDFESESWFHFYCEDPVDIMLREALGSCASLERQTFLKYAVFNVWKLILEGDEVLHKSIVTAYDSNDFKFNCLLINRIFQSWIREGKSMALDAQVGSYFANVLSWAISNVLV